MECDNFQTYTLLKATVCVHNSLHFAQSGISKIMKQDQIIGEGIYTGARWDVGPLTDR